MYSKSIAIIFFPLLGISATFLPWAHYPKGNGVIYGYLVDGIVTGFVFFLILLYGIFTFRKNNLKLIPAIIFGFFGLLMAIVSYSKIRDIEAEKINFSTDNPLIAAATAGFHQGIGIYIFGIAGLGIFITILLALKYQKRNSSPFTNSETHFKHRISNIQKYIIGIALFLGVLLTSFLIIRKNSISPSPEKYQKIFSKDISMMGIALANEDYATFIEYNHPVMIQSYGGKSQLIELLQGTLSELKKSGTTFKGSKIGQILDIRQQGRKIQAVLSQSITMTKNGIDQTEIQKMLAVSEDGGHKWYYINITGKNKDEIRKFFPEVNENIKF